MLSILFIHCPHWLRYNYQWYHQRINLLLKRHNKGYGTLTILIGFSCFFWYLVNYWSIEEGLAPNTSEGVAPKAIPRSLPRLSSSNPCTVISLWPVFKDSVVAFDSSSQNWAWNDVIPLKMTSFCSNWCESFCPFLAVALSVQQSISLALSVRQNSYPLLGSLSKVP